MQKATTSIFFSPSFHPTRYVKYFPVLRGVWRRKFLSSTSHQASPQPPAFHISWREEKFLAFFFVNGKKRKEIFNVCRISCCQMWVTLAGVLISFIAVATSTFLPWSEILFIFIFFSAPLLCKIKIPLIKNGKKNFAHALPREVSRGMG